MRRRWRIPVSDISPLRIYPAAGLGFQQAQSVLVKLPDAHGIAGSFSKPPAMPATERKKMAGIASAFNVFTGRL